MSPFPLKCVPKNVLHIPDRAAAPREKNVRDWILAEVEATTFHLLLP